MKQLVYKSLIVSFTLVGNALAASMPPGISVAGFAGNGWTAIGDVLVPTIGKSTNFTYINPQIYYHSDQSEYTASVGIGQRWLTEKAGILGAYVFGDFNHAKDGQTFWFVSPGVERLGEILDFSANLYIPVSSQRVDTGTELVSQTGDYSQITHSGHTEYDALLKNFDATGWGGDGQVGVHLPFLGAKLSVGGYYFTLKDSDNIIGGAIRAEVPVNRYFSVSLSEGYDTQAHNTIKAGLTMSLGERTSGKNVKILAERMTDAVQRQLIAVAGSSHTGQPVVQGVENTGQVVVAQDNISFFLPEGTATTSSGTTQGDGTYENPYVGFTQANIDNANQQNYRTFYLNSGTYNAIYSDGANSITLNNDQLFGRQNNFAAPAQDNNRPLINFTEDGFLISGGTYNQINGLSLQGTGKYTVGVNAILDATATTPTSFLIANTNIENFRTGVAISNNTSALTTATISNSVITGLSGDGITVQNMGGGDLNLNIVGDTITNNFHGLYLFNDSKTQTGNLNVTIKNALISENKNNGIYAYNRTGTLTLNVEKSKVTKNGYNLDDRGNPVFSSGMNLNNGLLYNTGYGNLVVNISNSIISNNYNNGITLGSTSVGSTEMNVNHSTIKGNLYNGVYAADTSATGPLTLNIDRSTIAENGATGVKAINATGTSVFTLNVTNSEVLNNQNGGFFIDDSGNGKDLTVNLSNTKVIGNRIFGIYAMNDLSMGSLNVSIAGSTISGNQGNGLYVDNHAKGSINVDISGSYFTGNQANGIQVFSENLSPSVPSGATHISIANSQIANNKYNGIALDTLSGSGPLTATITNSQIVNNLLSGVFASRSTIVNIDQSVISGNGTDLTAALGGTINVTNANIDYDIRNVMDGNMQFNGQAAPADATHVTCNAQGKCTFT